MRLTRIPVLLSVVVAAVAVAVLSLGLLGTASPVLAQEQELARPLNLAPGVHQAPPDFDLSFVVVFIDPALNVQVLDLSGNLVGEGEHLGAAKCTGDNCSWRTQLVLGAPLIDSVEIEYQFKTPLALDPEARRAVVSGKGTISSNGKKDRFSFSATFEDNRDGTVSATYVASRPDASFVIPKTPGTFWIFGRR